MIPTIPALKSWVEELGSFDDPRHSAMGEALLAAYIDAKQKGYELGFDDGAGKLATVEADHAKAVQSLALMMQERNEARAEAKAQFDNAFKLSAEVERLKADCVKAGRIIGLGINEIGALSSQLLELQEHHDTWRTRSQELAARVKAGEEAWAKVRSMIICTVDPVCAEHGFKEAMAAVAEMDALRSSAGKQDGRTGEKR